MGLIVVVGVALVVRLALVLTINNAQYSDSEWYDAAAARLASIGEYGMNGPSAWFPPGYSLVLAPIYAAFGHQQMAGKLLNVALGTATCGLVWAIGRRLAGPAVGLVAGLLLAVWPNFVFHTAILSSDVLAAFLFALVIWLGLLEPRPWIVALIGVLVGLAILTRPVSGILLAPLAVLWWVRLRSLRATTLWLAPVLGIALVMVGAWTVRNYVTFGEPILIATNGGYNFWQVNHRFADGNDTFWINVPMDDPEYATMSGGDEFTKSREGYRYGLAYLREHPRRFFELIPDKLFWLYHTDTSGLYEAVLSSPELSPSRVAAWLRERGALVESLTFRYYAAIGGLAILGALVAPPGARLLVLLPLLLTAFHMFFHTKDRFHVPLLPFAAIFAAVAIVRAAELLGIARSRSTRVRTSGKLAG